ncbi:hypothetical protein OG568_60315 (plasmid) [Streptomyces sp. NBC_01450]|uniref:hypothetical protein n=1 Tax=Streptomyces sp. NBC_01450 TaxID=2903871 RepID=UPI002E335066|nr:hypothetical protein [Streptomyces sp. NBC_01450]
MKEAYQDWFATFREKEEPLPKKGESLPDMVMVQASELLAKYSGAEKLASHMAGSVFMAMLNEIYRKSPQMAQDQLAQAELRGAKFSHDAMSRVQLPKDEMRERLLQEMGNLASLYNAPSGECKEMLKECWEKLDNNMMEYLQRAFPSHVMQVMQPTRGAAPGVALTASMRSAASSSTRSMSEEHRLFSSSPGSSTSKPRKM